MEMEKAELLDKQIFLSHLDLIVNSKKRPNTAGW